MIPFVLIAASLAAEPDKLDVLEPYVWPQPTQAMVGDWVRESDQVLEAAVEAQTQPQQVRKLSRSACEGTCRSPTIGLFFFHSAVTDVGDTAGNCAVGLLVYQPASNRPEVVSLAGTIKPLFRPPWNAPPHEQVGVDATVPCETVVATVKANTQEIADTVDRLAPKVEEPLPTAPPSASRPDAIPAQ